MPCLLAQVCIQGREGFLDELRFVRKFVGGKLQDQGMVIAGLPEMIQETCQRQGAMSREEVLERLRRLGYVGGP